MATAIFSAPDRRRLRDLGLLPEQIDELAKALPICRSRISKPAALADVRAVLRDAYKAVSNAADELTKFSSLNIDAYEEARIRFDTACFNNCRSTELRDEELLNVTLVYLDRSQASLKDAMTALPKVQRRHRSASPLPVMRIAEALLKGFTLAHKLPLPPYLLRASSSPGSAFREVVGVCYRTIGANEDPERAIKAYIRWRKARDRESRTAVGLPVDRISTQRVPRRVGRQVRRK